MNTFKLFQLIGLTNVMQLVANSANVTAYVPYVLYEKNGELINEPIDFENPVNQLPQFIIAIGSFTKCKEVMSLIK